MKLKHKELYNYMYSKPLGRGGLYGIFGRRDAYFVEYIKNNVPRGSSVLDAGCGRGLLIRWLTAIGYSIRGTEIADWLVRPGGDLFGLPVDLVSYSNLNVYHDNTFDVVISNDVLEHLDCEDDVIRGMSDLARISKKWLLISTGGDRASASYATKETGVANLHSIIRPMEWWQDLYQQHCDIDTIEHRAGSWFFFGRIKDNVRDTDIPAKIKQDHSKDV